MESVPNVSCYICQKILRPSSVRNHLKLVHGLQVQQKTDQNIKTTKQLSFVVSKQPESDSVTEKLRKLEKVAAILIQNQRIFHAVEKSLLEKVRVLEQKN